jgi:hypothetical protein
MRQRLRIIGRARVHNASRVCSKMPLACSLVAYLPLVISRQVFSAHRYAEASICFILQCTSVNSGCLDYDRCALEALYVANI